MPAPLILSGGSEGGGSLGGICYVVAPPTNLPARFKQNSGMRGFLIVLLGTMSAAVASPPQVTCTNTNPAELSGNVTLRCEFQANLEVLQITWQKKRGKKTQNMVTCSEKYGTHVTDGFKKHIAVLKATSAESSILITKLEKEDEACYNCLFNAYPNGAFTGEVCLTDLKSINEVLCSGQGNDLRVVLNPQEIRMRQSVQLNEKKIGAPDFFTVKGQYLDPSINPTCDFWFGKERVEEDQNNPPEEADKFITRCSASGTMNFVITWHNKGQPVSQEDKENKTGNLITVTSTLIHTVSSLPADHRITCTIKPDGPEVYEGQQQRSWVRYLLITFAGVLFLVILLLILFWYKVCKKREARTPSKHGEKGPEAPTSSIKKLVGVINRWNSPKFSTENDSGPARLSSPVPKRAEEPTSSNKKLGVINGWDSPKLLNENDSGTAIPSPETLGSPIKKRNPRSSEKKTNATRKLAY